MSNITTIKQPDPPFVDWVYNGKVRDAPKATKRNAEIALDALDVKCAYDTFADRRYVAGQLLGSQVGQLTDDVCLLIRTICRDRFGFDPGKDNLWDAINLKCRLNSYHPIRDYLDNLEFTWDGKPRIDTWLTDYLGVKDTPFVRVIGRLALIASVRRVRQPGCKWDYMPVLVGPENKAKSLAIETLYGKKYFSDQKIIGISDKELAEAVRGRWAMESADLAGLRKADVDHLKAQITRQTDRVRPAYGRAVVDVARQCALWGTTNDPIFLRSQHGNRRMPPLITGKILVDAIARDRDQLWAEANAAEREHGPSLALPESVWEEAQAIQDAHTEFDPWRDELADVAAWAAKCADIAERANAKAGPDAKLDAIPYESDPLRGDERVSSSWLLTVPLRIDPERQSPALSHRLSTVMQTLGWSGPLLIRIGGVPQRGYKRMLVEEE
jgi:predicted P-loop ATPase